MSRNWTDTLKDRDAGLEPGFLPVDVPLEQHAELAGVDEPYVTDEAGDDTPAPRDARADALEHAGRPTELEAMTKAELIATARERGVEYDTRWTKAELVTALQSASS